MVEVPERTLSEFFDQVVADHFRSAVIVPEFGCKIRDCARRRRHSGGFIGANGFRVGPIIFDALQPETAHCPVDVKPVLEFERNIVRSRDDHDVEGHTLPGLYLIIGGNALVTLVAKRTQPVFNALAGLPGVIVGVELVIKLTRLGFAEI